MPPGQNACKSGNSTTPKNSVCGPDSGVFGRLRYGAPAGNKKRVRFLGHLRPLYAPAPTCNNGTLACCRNQDPSETALHKKAASICPRAQSGRPTRLRACCDEAAASTTCTSTVTTPDSTRVPATSRYQGAQLRTIPHHTMSNARATKRTRLLLATLEDALHLARCGWRCVNSQPRATKRSRRGEERTTPDMTDTFCTSRCCAPRLLAKPLCTVKYAIAGTLDAVHHGSWPSLCASSNMPSPAPWLPCTKGTV